MACRSGGPINRPLRCDRPRADRYPAGDSMRTRVNRKTVLVALLALGGLTSPARAATFVYVGNADSQDITVLELKSNGDLTPVETAAVPGPAKPGSSLPLAVSPDRKRLYAGLRNEPYSVVTFAIDAKTGKLTPNDPPSVSIKAKAGARHLVFSPSGTFVYLVDELDASIYVFPWDAKTGTLKKEVQVATALPRGFEGKPWAADIHLTPDGRFLYASERTTSTL